MISNKLLVSRPSLCIMELVTISTKHKEGNINRNMRRSTISTLCEPKESLTGTTGKCSIKWHQEINYKK